VHYELGFALDMIESERKKIEKV